MEEKEHKVVTEFLELMTKINFFTRLKPENRIDNSFSVTLKVSSYNELQLMISDLLKASIMVLQDNGTDINAMTLVEIAFQLLPQDEMGLLDDLHKIHLKA
ncbi:hypothetical protein [Flavobacterium sp. ENC]|uniref:hypothetical protein n=1 Tax=Flavobacterium sp. ENC TaxID=2897330 RepID=UPI001E637ACA|nr:hypothetical protein [Flavobacterium sp. ENC]MCD0466247.1 hypothetical protein [Flavobacterium sp. ENC]